MDLGIESFMEIVSTYGFPIVAWFLMWKYVTKDINKAMESIITAVEGLTRNVQLSTEAINSIIKRSEADGN